MSKHLVSQVARARQQTLPNDGLAFPNSREWADLSFREAGQFAHLHVRRKGNWAEKRGCQEQENQTAGPKLTEPDGETRWPMVTKIMEWVSISALLMVVTWRPFAGYQVPLDLVVCAGAVMGVLALFFIKYEVKSHYDA